MIHRLGEIGVKVRRPVALYRDVLLANTYVYAHQTILRHLLHGGFVSKLANGLEDALLERAHLRFFVLFQPRAVTQLGDVVRKDDVD